MSDPGERVIISHPDGRRYSVTRKAFAAVYEKEGFEVGEPETPEAFLHDAPAPATRAGARRKTVKNPRKPA
jgi:hypothetical protein